MLAAEVLPLELDAGLEEVESQVQALEMSFAEFGGHGEIIAHGTKKAAPGWRAKRGLKQIPATTYFPASLQYHRRGRA